MLNNEKVTESDLSECIYKQSMQQITGSHVLCIQDTTEINYRSHMGRLKKSDSDIGPVTNNKDGGGYCHPTLMVDAQSKTPLGFSHIKLWNRSWDKLGKRARNYSTLEIESKESYRWIESALESEKRLPAGVTQTIVADRECDIYQALHKIPGSRSHLLIRSSHNRRLETENVHLLEKMRSLPSTHTYELSVKGNHSRKNRTTTLNLRYGKVSVLKPENLKEDYPESISVYCIYVVEDIEKVPVNEKPIEWRLLTTHHIESPEDAMQCIEWYKARWYIEEIFRLVKSDGMDVESAQLESGKSLKKLVLLSLISAWHIMALKLSYDRVDEENLATIIFNDQQMELLGILCPALEGKTEKQKNPYKKRTCVWAAWIIARLGGWTGYQSQAKPGYITFAEGYRDFLSKYEALRIFKNVYRE